MSQTIVAVDAMGGDNAPLEIVKGAVEAVQENANIKVLLYGIEDQVKKELAKYKYNEAQIQVVHKPEVIATEEPPVQAVRTKKESSMVGCMYAVKNGEADGLVTAGSSGACLVGGQIIVGRIKGVERSPFASLIPTEKGFSLLLDCGANVDARPNHIVQFAQMGSVYMENIMGVKNPSVGLVNIGAEEEKGNALVKETMPVLKEAPNINFVGSCEARDIPAGYCDVVVAEAFVGNVILKMYEGVGLTVRKIIKKGLMSNLRSKIGGFLIKPALKESMKAFDAAKYGGAPMLGLKGLVVKTHGNAKAEEVKNSIFQVVSFKEMEINDKIRRGLCLEEK